ncbi:MAG: LysM peptidoglycan-binding domain-containing protein [Chloroflexi bacterium]|nr:LysM peptidoglycan-binding domain-containing protein [Chloroflexota bacterium]
MDGSADDPAAAGTSRDAPDVVAAPEAVVCPYLHLQSDPNTSAAFAHEGHACFKAVPPSRVATRIQERFCLSGVHPRCPVYRGALKRPPGPRRRLPQLDSRQVVGLLAFAVLLPAVLGAVFALVSDGDGESRAVDSVGVGPAGALAEQAEQAADAVAVVQESAVTPEEEAAVEEPEAAASPDEAEEIDPRPPIEQLLAWDVIAEREVLAGETLSLIAGQLDTTVEAIIRYNGLPNDEIFEGQILRVPVGFALDLSVVVVELAEDEIPFDAGPVETLRAWPRMVEYSVQSGDSLLLIAANFGTTAEAIALTNELGGGAIFAGQTLLIPVGYVLDLTGESDLEIDDPIAVLQHWPQLVEYRVGEGDALSAVAVQHGTTPEAIARYNGFEGDTIILGALLIVPVNFQLPLPPVEAEESLAEGEEPSAAQAPSDGEAATRRG